MFARDVCSLNDCSDFRQAVLLRPPAVVHAAAALLAGLLAAALTWAALTEADLVVRSPGRVRPRDCPEQSFTAVSGDKVSPVTAGRVAEVRVKLGDEVRQGDVLFRLESERIDNEARRRRLTIRA